MILLIFEKNVLDKWHLEKQTSDSEISYYR